MADTAVPVLEYGDREIPKIEECTPVEQREIPKIEECTPLPDPRYAPTRKSWELMRESFRGEEPLAFIEDPQTRDFLRVLTDRSDNPEEERKKWALASYFSQNSHSAVAFCHGNLDLFLKKFYNNEPVSIDHAYRDIGAALGVQQRDRAWFENSTAGAAISGTAKTMNTFFIEPPAFLSKLWVAANTAQMNAQLLRTSVFNPEAAKLIRDPQEAGEAVEAMIRNLYTEYYASVEEAAWRDANVPDDWMTNSDSLGNWCRNAALSLVNYLPQLAMQTGLMAATGGVSALGTVYGISGYYDIKDDHPEMSESDAVVYGVGVGLINGVLEKVTLGIIDGKVSKKVAVDGLKKGILQAARHFGWNASKEGAEEGLEEFAQNLLDIAMGLRGDTGEWKSSDWWREMRRGVPESAFLGFATGGPLAFDSYRNLRKVALRRETIRSTISDRVEELSAKDSLSAREEQELEELQTVMDAGNPADMEKAVRDVYEREVIRNQEEVNRREHEADRREEQEELELTDDEILLRNAQRAERNQRLRRKLPHNPQETVETATELLRDFPEISLDIVYSIDELPEPVRAKIDAEGLDSNRIRAWVDEDSDIVHLIADRVRPSEVGRVIGHEVIGHKGLRAVFGERFDSLLDLVYRDHFEEVAKLGERYHRDTETLENRRYLTEEFLAECADAKVKPSWWKEFLGFVRQQLRRILPKMRFTDADIESALSRSARAMRRRNRTGRNAEIGVRNWLRFSSALTDDPEGGKAFPKRKASTYAEARNQLRSLQGKTFVNADSGIEAVLSSTGINKLLSNKAREKSFANGFTNAEHFEAISNIDRLYENAVLVETHEDRKGSEHIRSIKRFAAPFYTGKTFAEAYITVKESIQAGHRIYSLELDELKKPSTVKKGVRPGLLTRPADGTLPDTVADTTKQYPVAGSYNKLLDKTEKSRALLEKEEKKSHFSIIGEEGAAAAAEWYGRQDAEMWKMLGLDLSTQQGNAVRRLEDLSVAKRMAEAGKEAETIKLATGWEKGADGKWRTETDDNWQFSPEFLRLEPYESLPIDRCIQEGTELFSAYPELREFNVRLSTSLEMQQSKGWFDREGEEIVLQQDGLPAMKKTLIHEIQHYIQEQEGFAPGGNLYTASRLAATGNYSSTELADAYRKFHDNVKLLPGDLYENIGRVLHEDSFRNFRNVLGEELGELWGSKETAIDFMRNAYDSSNRETFLQIYEAELEKAKKGHPDAFSLYRRLAGEVEARNAEKRSGLSLEERLRTLLANTEDVSEQDKIYLEKNTADLPLSREEDGAAKDVKQVKRLDHSRYQENTMLAADAPIPVVTIARKWMTVSDAEAVIDRKIKQNHGKFFIQQPEQKMPIQVVTHASLDEASSEKAVSETISDGTSPEIHAAALCNLEELLQHARLGVSHRDWHVHAKNQIRGVNRETALQIHRFYVGMRYGEAIYGVKLTVREKRNGDTVFYTLEAHDLNIQEITPDTEASGGGVAKPALPAETPVIQFNAFFEKFKPIVDLLGLKYKEMYPDIRFGLGEYSEADQRDIVAILQPYVGMNTEREPVDYRKYLAEHGVEISEQDAWEFALEAVRQNIAFARKRSEERRKHWLYENYPLYKECVDFCGSADFKIKPSIRFSGEAFSGSWISPEFVKYSEKRKRGPKETDSSYRRYQERREAALARAEGTASDEIAESIARRTGRDTLEVEQELIDFFRDLKKRDFYHEYTNFREEQILGDKQEARAAFDEWIQEEEKRIQNEVVELLEQGRPITAEWIGENKKIFDELYRQLFDGKTPPGKVGKADLEAINAAIMQQGSNAATFAQAYKVAREKAYGEFMEKLRAFRDKVMAANADAISLQRDAVSFAEQNLPAESRGEFTRGILKLMEYSTAPTGKYPEGRRMREFRSLVERMVNRAGELRKTTAQNEIREMLDAVKVKRNYKGIATAVIPSEQERVERIRRVIDMNIASLAKAVDANNEQIMKLEESGEEPALLKKYQEDNQLLEMFGDLEHRSANDVEEAAEKLKNIIFGGKMAFFDLLSKRRDRINDMRSRALDDITFGKLETFVRVDPEYFTKYWLKNQSLGTLMRLASGKSIQDFDNSVFGELYREVEDSTQTEQTALRRMQRDFDEALRTICGVDGNYVARMKKKGKFFRMISEVNENSGVFKTEFSRGVDLESKKYPNKLLEHGRRAVLKKLIPVEDSEFHGETREGARSLLRRIDNGEAITEWDGFLLDDITIDFLRQQLADFDAGLEQSYEIFNEKQDDENFNRLLADARKEAQVMLLGHSSQESRRRVEVPLSQGAALQLLLTWEQEDFRPNMKWNGWSEESMRQIREFLKPEVLRMGYWMRDYIARNQKQLDAAVSKRYGAHLPGIENYFPGVFKGPNSRSVESEFGRGYGAMSINPNFLISRKFHLKPADIDADAFSTFFGNQINQAHFLAWSDTIRDLNAVYGSMRVKNAITNNFGRGVEENIRERIAVLAQGGDPRGDGYIARLFGKMFRNWVPAKIIANQGSIIKQMLGTVSYMNHVPVMEFVKYSAKANFSNPEFREFVRWAKNTDYMKNRLAGGLDRDLSYLLNYTRDSRAYSPLAEGLIDLGTWGTRWADAWSTLHGGYAVYMYALEQARRDGKTEAEAREAARRAWMRATDETQQSGYLKDQNYFQANQGGYRYLTAFMSNPIQTMNLQIQTFHELRYGKDKKAALQKLGRQILINHLIVPSLMIATTDLIRHGFDFGEWWDELEWEDYLIGWLLGSFESLFLLGKVLGNVGNYALDRLIGRKRPFYQSIVAFPMVEDISYDIGFLSKLIDSDKPVTEKEVFSSIRALGDFLMAGGIADRFAPLGPVGALLHAIGSQGKRIAGWFEEK